MKTIPKLLFVLMFALCATAAQARVVIGFHFGIPLYWPEPVYVYPPPPYYYPAPVYYPPAVVQVPAAPAVQQAPPPDYSWYYCPSAKGYYPYVRDCPGGWQRVSPTPPQ